MVSANTVPRLVIVRIRVSRITTIFFMVLSPFLFFSHHKDRAFSS